MISLDSIADLKNYSISTNESVNVLGYYYKNDGGGGIFYFNSSLNLTPNGGTIFQSNLSSTGRWIRTNLDLSVNARWFGCKGDGISNDTQALQNAADFAGVNHFSLYIPTGNYLLFANAFDSYGLRIQHDGMKVYGDGFDSQLISAPNVQCAAVVGVLKPVGQIKNIIVSNISINGNKLNQNGNWFQKCLTVVALNNESSPLNVLIDSVHCFNAYSYDPNNFEGGGISLTGNDTSFYYNDFYKQNIVVSNCYCWDNEGWGIGTNWSSGIIINNNTCWNNSTMGITVWNSQDTIIDSNRCYDNGSIGINAEISDRVTISNNNVYSTTYSCIRLFNSILSIVANNICKFNVNYYDYSGISLESGNGYNGGIYKTRPCNNITINSNIIESNGSDGMPLKSFAFANYLRNKNIIVTSNNVINNTTFKGVELNAIDLNFSHNKIIGTIALFSDSGFLNFTSNDVSYPYSQTSFNLITIQSGVYVNLSSNTFFVNQNCNAIFAITTYISKTLIAFNITRGPHTRFVQLYNNAVNPTLRLNESWL